MCLGIPGQIIEITDDTDLTRQGRVQFEGVTQTVQLSFVPEARVGDFVVVHVGFAISVLDPTSAAEVAVAFSEFRREGEESAADLGGGQ